MDGMARIQVQSNGSSKSNDSKNNVATPDQEIPIFLITPNDIFPPAAVTAVSVLENTKSKVKFYFLQRKTLPVSKSNRENFEKLKENYPNFSVEYISIDPKPFDELAECRSKYIPNDAYYRYIIPNVAPNLDKAIYLDVDTIVQCDVAELYNISLEENYIAAVNYPEAMWEDPDFYYVVSKLELDNPYFYVNSGVLVINSKKWREDNIPDTLIKQTKENEDKITWCDQDIINIAMQGRIKEIHWSFNAILSYFTDYGYSPKEAKIIHYAGPKKPWTGHGSFRSLFQKYAEKTPFLKKLKKMRKIAAKKETVTYRLFRFIPILSVRTRKNEKVYYLFGFIPLMRRYGESE